MIGKTHNIPEPSCYGILRRIEKEGSKKASMMGGGGQRFGTAVRKTRFMSILKIGLLSYMLNIF